MIALIRQIGRPAVVGNLAIGDGIFIFAHIIYLVGWLSFEENFSLMPLPQIIHLSLPG